MLRALARAELVLSLPLMALAAWPWTGYCSGRPGGMDCESWLIFGVNLFGPLGVLALVCSLWTLKTKSPVPQYVLALGCAALLAWWAWHMI